MASNKQFSTKQETGYTDPLSNCAEFNILNFINSSDNPDSPDIRYCQQSNYPSMNGNVVHLEQQQMQQRQQMPNQMQQNQMQRQMHPVILDNNILYTNGATQLPDSPPITGEIF